MNSAVKKNIAAFAGLMILLYHCWMPVLAKGTVLGTAERFIVSSTFIGVDLFFFISAYSLAARPVGRDGPVFIKAYGKFLLNRAIRIVPLFVIALVWGRFLWFLPAIMFMYIVFPPLHIICRKKPILSFVLLLAVWAGLTYIILGLIKPKADLGIFLFRVPVIILGAYAPGIAELFTSKRSTEKPIPISTSLLQIIFGTAFIVFGSWLVYRYGFQNRLNKPFYGTFYLVGIPQMLGIVLLISGISNMNKKHSKTIQTFGSMTLELYFMQMVLGTYLTNTYYSFFGSKIITNLATLASVIFAAFALMLLSRFVCRIQTRKQTGRSSDREGNPDPTN